MAHKKDLWFGAQVVTVDEGQDAIVVGLTQTTVTIISEVPADYPGGEGTFMGSTRTVAHDQVEVA